MKTHRDVKRFPPHPLRVIGSHFLECTESSISSILWKRIIYLKTNYQIYPITFCYVNILGLIGFDNETDNELEGKI